MLDKFSPYERDVLWEIARRRALSECERVF